MKKSFHLSLLAGTLFLALPAQALAPAAAAGVFLGRVTARYPRVVAFGTGAMAYPFIKAFVAPDDEENPTGYGDRLHVAYDDLAETGEYLSKTGPVLYGIGVYYSCLEKFKEARAQREAEKKAAPDTNEENIEAGSDTQEGEQSEDNAPTVPAPAKASQDAIK